MSAREVLDCSPGSKANFAPCKKVVPVTLQELPPWTEPALSTALDKEELERRLIAHELEIARKIQQSLLPKSLPSLPGFDLAAFCHSARQVGGDFYEVLPLAKDCLLLVIADVMGKGVPAALFAATLRTLVRTLADLTKHPSELLARMNRLMFEELSAVDMFITVQVAVADTRHRRLVVANAGHCPLLFVNRDGTAKPIAPEGMPLGILADGSYAEQTEPLEELVCALLYTDGVTETRNAQGEPYGQIRLQNWLCNYAGRQRMTAAELKQSFLAEFSSFQSDAAPHDDQSFLLLAGNPDRQPKSKP